MAGPGAATDTEKQALSPKKMEPGGTLLCLLVHLATVGLSPAPAQGPLCSSQAAEGWQADIWWLDLAGGPVLKCVPQAVPTPGESQSHLWVQGGLWVCHCGKAWEALSGQRWWRKVGSVLVRAPGCLFLCMGSRGCHMGENT